MDNLNINLQSIRKSVMHSQLLALEAQAQALYYLNNEHNNGIDLGHSPRVLMVVQNVKDVAATAKILVEDAKKVKSEELFGRLEALQALAQTAVERADKLCLHAAVDAEHRLEEALEENLDKGESPTEVPAVPHDTKHLQVRADMACYGAETNQFNTLKLQSRAICDLALELTFTAAAEAGHKFPTVSAYWHRK